MKFQTHRKREIVDITDEVSSKIAERKIENGLCHLFIKHTTAAITTADLDPGTDQDMLDVFEAIIPKLNFRHPHDPSHVSDHIAATLIGPSIVIPIEDGKLVLGTWQRVVLVELDGPREREVVITLQKV